MSKASPLPDDQMQRYEDEWQRAQDFKQSIIDGRWELESYTRKLKVGDAIWARYQNTKPGNQKAKTEYAAQSAYEKALEHLDELISANPAIELFDFILAMNAAQKLAKYRDTSSHNPTTQ